MNTHPPLWGNFIFYADHDLLSFAVLYQNGLMVPAMYHGTQAIEKYLKALVLSILDPDGRTETPSNNQWLKTHNLVELAERCSTHNPYYTSPEVVNNLQRFTEYDQAARYPWVNRKHGNGFSSAEIPILEDIIFHLRNDIPIQRDDYPLGIFVRGYHHGCPEALVNDTLSNRQRVVLALRNIFRNLEGLIRN